jgi:hypothetical protein
LYRLDLVRCDYTGTFNGSQKGRLFHEEFLNDRRQAVANLPFFRDKTDDRAIEGGEQRT